jgi:hypothetical protein
MYRKEVFHGVLISQRTCNGDEMSNNNKSNK